MLFSRFVAEIEKNVLLKKGDTVVAAVSGGADSVCLLHLLHRLSSLWDLKLFCAHVNHMLRLEAGEEAAFVASLCKEWDIPFLLHEVDIAKIAKEEKISTELAGRNARYAFLASIPADVRMTAHHKNDSVESVLLHLVRGVGLDGLCGISPKREDGICRPLLPFTKPEIEAYLKENGCTWCEDASNFSSVYTRNKIRNEILPLLEEINPSFTEAVFRMTEILKGEREYLETETARYPVTRMDGETVLFSIDILSSMPLALRRRAVRKTVESFEEVEKVLALLSAKNGVSVSLSGGKTAEREEENIAIYTPKREKIEPVELPMEGTLHFGLYTITVGDGGMKLPRKRYTVRTRKNGDSFVPEGMKGHKKIKDFLIDKKIPRRLRDELPIIICEDQIAAVANVRRSQAFRPNTEEETISLKIERTPNV